MNDAVRLLARQLLNTQRQRLAVEIQTKRFMEDGLSAPSFMIAEQFVTDLKAQERILYKHLSASVDPHDPIKLHMDAAVGLGPATLLMLGLLPKRPREFETKEGRLAVGALNKYLGIYPGAAKRTAGVKLGYSSVLRAILLERVAMPCIRNMKSPYRSVYDQRRAVTMLSHPPMRPMGTGCDGCDAAWKKTKSHRAARKITRERLAPAVDCSNMGGQCWTDGHRHRDAIRLTAKAIVLDLWLVDSGKEPVLGASTEPGNYCSAAPGIDSVVGEG
jgi:hypothetical protein